MSLHRVTMTAIVELPDGDERFDMYNATDPGTCIGMDFDEDPPAFLLELCDEMEIINVEDIL